MLTATLYLYWNSFWSFRPQRFWHARNRHQSNRNNADRIFLPRKQCEGLQPTQRYSDFFAPRPVIKNFPDGDWTVATRVDLTNAVFYGLPIGNYVVFPGVSSYIITLYKIKTQIVHCSVLRDSYIKPFIRTNMCKNWQFANSILTYTHQHKLSYLLN